MQPRVPRCFEPANSLPNTLASLRLVGGRNALIRNSGGTLGNPRSREFSTLKAVESLAYATATQGQFQPPPPTRPAYPLFAINAITPTTTITKRMAREIFTQLLGYSPAMRPVYPLITTWKARRPKL